MSRLSPIDECLFNVHATVERFGWALQYVMADPPWAYSIGLAWRFDHPELVVMGLDSSSSAGLLNHLARRIAAGERLPDPPAEMDTPGGAMRLGAVHPFQWEHGRFAVWVSYHGSRELYLEPRALQVVWADDAGRFPPDPRFPQRLARLQPLLDGQTRRGL